MAAIHSDVRGRGFTLVEMATVLAIMGILLALAGPGLSELVGKERARTAAFDLLASLNYARSEAIKRGIKVDVEQDGATWNAGWKVQYEAGGVTTVLRRQAASKNVGISYANDSLSYRRDGRIDGSASAFTLTYTGSGGSTLTKTVLVDLSGRPSIK